MKNLLITGRPAVGKTTLIKHIWKSLSAYKPAGFYTEEIKKNNKRCGFKIVSSIGVQLVLAHKETPTEHKLGSYYINLTGFEEFLSRLWPELDKAKLVIIDEIGKMECISNTFVSIIQRLLESDKVFLATISLKGNDIIQKIKNREDVKIFELTESNREALKHKITKILQEIL